MIFRIVVWNCAMSLDAKYEALLALGPDLAVIPECSEPDILRRRAPGFTFRDVEWTGQRSSKGLGVFAFGAFSLRRHPSWDRTRHIMLPIEVRGPVDLNLLAVWAFNHRVPATVTPNPTTTEDAIRHYAPFLSGSLLAPPLVAGDFNASVVWDKKTNPAFANLNATLEELRMTSAYHAATEEHLGAESSPTLLWQKKAHQPFHIDYIYIPHVWRDSIRRVHVGRSEDWTRLSDHVPLLLELELNS